MGNGERGTSSAVEATVEREDGEFGCAGGLEEQKRSADVFLVPAVSQEKAFAFNLRVRFPHCFGIVGSILRVFISKQLTWLTMHESISSLVKSLPPLNLFMYLKYISLKAFSFAQLPHIIVWTWNYKV
jgi:hypothetical protein